MAEELGTFLQGSHQRTMPLGEALRLGRQALERAANGRSSVPPQNLEVCLLEKARIGRKFRRLATDELNELLAG
jgi:hypothetical protein